eukprot:6149377-Amphidinium_carterae.1
MANFGIGVVSRRRGTHVSLPTGGFFVHVQSQTVCRQRCCVPSAPMTEISTVGEKFKLDIDANEGFAFEALQWGTQAAVLSLLSRCNLCGSIEGIVFACITMYVLEVCIRCSVVGGAGILRRDFPGVPSIAGHAELGA